MKKWHWSSANFFRKKLGRVYLWSHSMFSYHPFLAFETSASRKNLKLLITPWSLNVLQLKKEVPMLHILQPWISSPSSSWTSNSCEWFKCPMLCKSWLKHTTMQLFVCFFLMGWNLFLVGFFHVGYPNSFQKTTYWCCNGNVKKVVEIVSFRFFSEKQVKWDCRTFKEFLLQISLRPGSFWKTFRKDDKGSRNTNMKKRFCPHTNEKIHYKHCPSFTALPKAIECCQGNQ